MTDQAPVETVVAETPVVTETPVATESTQNETWYQGEDYSDLASGFESQDDMMKEFTNARTLIGKKGVIIPDGDEGWDEFYNGIGKPEEAGGYELDENFNQFAFDNNLTKRQAESIFNANKASDMAFSKEMEVLDSKFQSDIMNEFGDQAQSTIERAADYANKLGIVDLITGTELAMNLEFVKMLASHSTQTQSPVLTNPQSIVGETSIAEQLAEIRQDKDYGNIFSDKGKALNAKALKLTERMMQQ